MLTYKRGEISVKRVLDSWLLVKYDPQGNVLYSIRCKDIALLKELNLI